MESKSLKLFGFLQDQTYSIDCAGYLKEGEEEGRVTLKERVPGEGGRERWGRGRKKHGFTAALQEREAGLRRKESKIGTILEKSSDLALWSPKKSHVPGTN